MTGCGETIILNECETFYGLVESTQDALLIFEACNLGVLRRVKRRLAEEERKSCVRPGAVFVYDENESGIKRWTDGKEWSPSRILGNFLVYRELQKKISRREGGGPGGSGLPPELCGRELQILGSTKGTFVFKNDGLIKKTISVAVNGSMHHLVCYCMKEIDPVLRLYPPGAYRELAGIPVRQEFVEAQNFRRPLKIVRYGENGMPERRSISTRGSVEEDESFPPEEVAAAAAAAASASRAAAAAGFQAAASATPAASSSSASAATFGSGLDLTEEDIALTELSSVNECSGLNIHDLHLPDIGVGALDMPAAGAAATGFPDFERAIMDGGGGDAMGRQAGPFSGMRPQAWDRAGADLSPLLFSIPPFAAVGGDGAVHGRPRTPKHRGTQFAASTAAAAAAALSEQRAAGTAYPRGASASAGGDLESLLARCGGAAASGYSTATFQSGLHQAGGLLHWQDAGAEVLWQMPRGRQASPGPAGGALLVGGVDAAVDHHHFDASCFDANGFDLGAALPEHSGLGAGGQFGSAVDESDFRPATHAAFDHLAQHDAYTALWSVPEM